MPTTIYLPEKVEKEFIAVKHEFEKEDGKIIRMWEVIQRLIKNHNNNKKK